MTITKLEKLLRSKKGYLKKSPSFLANFFNVPLEEVQALMIPLRKEILYPQLKKQREEGKTVITKKEKQEDVVIPFVLNAWNNKTGKPMNIDEYCDTYGFNREDIVSYNMVTHNKTPYYNVKFKEVHIGVDGDEVLESFKSALDKMAEAPKVISSNLNEHIDADRLVITDIHIGMDPNPEGKSIYKFKWNKEKLFKTANEIVASVIRKQRSKVLIIDDLGDLPDGLGGKTTRGGHGLPQNMTDIEVFNAAIEFKLQLVHELKGYYTFIYVNNVCEDNHGGVFTNMINTAFKKIIDVKYQDVLVTNHEEFFSHYVIGSHCKILCHGKDSKDLKYGLGVKPTPETISKIEQYIDHHEIPYQTLSIEFSKGDSHQCVYDMAASDKFNYMSYPALSPSSKWIQSNFKKGRRGFVIEHLTNKNEDIRSTIWIK